MIDTLGSLVIVGEVVILGLIGYVFILQRRTTRNNKKQLEYLTEVDINLKNTIDNIVNEVKKVSQAAGEITGREKQESEDRVESIEKKGLK